MIDDMVQRNCVVKRWLAPNAPSFPIMPVSIAPPPIVSTTQEMMPECGKRKL
jgi:hypothetical protein